MILCFENYQFDTDRHELRRDDVYVPLEPQVAAVLKLLLLRKGAIISRDELLAEVWNGKTVSPANIDVRIKTVRQALGDDGTRQRFVKTIPSQGFRFVGDVHQIRTADANDPSQPAVPYDTPNTGELRFQNRPWFRVAAALATFTVFVLGFGYGFDVLGFGGGPVTAAAQDPGRDVATFAVLPVEVDSRDGVEFESGQHIRLSLINYLSKFPGTRVASHLSADRLKSEGAFLGQAGNELNASYLVTSRLSVLNQEFSFNVMLIDPDSGTVLWSGTHHAEANLQSLGEATRVAAIGIANKLGVTINLPYEQLLNPKASDFFSRAETLLTSNNREAISEAVVLLESAHELEPRYIPILSLLAFAKHRATSYSGEPRWESAAEIEAIRRKVNMLSPNSVDAIIVEGLVGIYRSSYEDALALFERAVGLDPNSLLATVLVAEQYEFLQETELANSTYKRALALDPTSPFLLAKVASGKFALGDITEALDIAKSNLEWNPNDVDSLTVLGRILRASGDYKTAKTVLKKSLELNPTSYEAQLEQLFLYRSMGRLQEIHGTFGTATMNAVAYAFDGEKARAHSELSKDPSGILNAYTRYLLGDSRPLYTFLQRHKYGARLRYDGANFSRTNVFESVFIADILRRNQNEDADVILNNLGRYFADREHGDFWTEEEFLAEAGYATLVGDFDTAIVSLRASADRGFASIGTLKATPVFESLRSHPQFEEILNAMQRNVAGL